jgi:hypothetical protein
MSILIGSLAIAVSLFVVNHHQYAFYEATHDNYLTFLVDALPYLWLIVFGSMLLLAIYNWRHTSKGYRYSLTTILTSSVLVSFVGGAGLHLFGLGYQLDRILGDNVDMYVSQAKKEAVMWQDPDNGRLLGSQSYSTLSPSSTIIFADSSGKNWVVDVSELHEDELSLLRSQSKIKLIGIMPQKKTVIFHACAAFPWLLDNIYPTDNLKQERRRFVNRMQEYVGETDEVVMTKGRFSLASSSLKQRSICSRLSVVQTMAY